MATNLISLVMQYLTPDMISRIASALGLDRDSAHTAIGAAIPALLAGFSNAADNPGGAQKLLDAVTKQTGALDNIAGMIGGSGQSSLLDQGSTLLRSVLGGQDQTALAGAVSKYAGIGQGVSGSLLAMLAPIVTGMIGKQLGGRNLDARNLTDLLSSQQQQIAQALPGGFAKLLSGTGILDSLGGAATSAAATAGQAAQAAAAATRQATQYASPGVSRAGAMTSAVPTWIYWVLPLAVVAGLILYLMNRSEPVLQSAAVPAKSVVVGGVDIGTQLTDSLNAARTSLQGITDIETARAALPRVQAATAQVERVRGMLGQLSADQRKVISDMTASANVALSQHFNKAMTIPGVNEVLKPATDRLRIQLAELSTQPSTVGSGRQ